LAGDRHLFVGWHDQSRTVFWL